MHIAWLPFALASPVDLYERYDGNMVVRMNIRNNSAAEMLNSLVNDNPSYSYWSDSEFGNVDIMVSKASLDHLKAMLSGIDVQVMIPNLQDLIESEAEHTAKNSALVSQRLKSKGIVPSAQEIFKDYQDTEVYVAFLESLPGATPISIGKTFEGREIRGVKFGTGPKNIVFHGGLHAREWITGAVATFIADQLLANSTIAVELRSQFTFSVIPILNPDGYAFSRTKDRMWRKNRQPTGDPNCIGIDLNRNFPSHWNESGSSGRKCDDLYHGEKPMEALETAAIYNYVKELGNVVSYIDLHAYSHLFILAQPELPSSKSSQKPATLQWLHSRPQTGLPL